MSPVNLPDFLRLYVEKETPEYWICVIYGGDLSQEQYLQMSGMPLLRTPLHDFSGKYIDTKLKLYKFANGDFKTPQY